MASRAILTFCVEQGTFNGFMVGLVTCIDFLDNEQPSPPKGAARERALRDLFEILKGRPSEGSIRSWIESHYH